MSTGWDPNGVAYFGWCGTTMYYVVNGMMWGIDFDNATMAVIADALGHVRMLVDPNGNTPFVASYDAYGHPMGQYLTGVLEQYLEKCRPALNPHLGEPALFLSQEGLRLGYEAIAAIVAKLARRAGIKRRVSPHDLRRALGTHLLMSGADVRHVQAILGHRSLETTDRYLRLHPAEVFRAFRKYHPRAWRPVDNKEDFVQ